MLRPIIVSLIAVVGLSGCLREPPEIYLPVDHPADPEARSGAPIKITNALVTEFENVKPQINEPKPDKKEMQTDDHSGHQMHKQ